MVLSASTFVEVLFACFIVIPVVLLWGAAIVEIIRSRQSGWGVAGWLLAVCVFPILGPLAYFALRPTPPADRQAEAQAAYMAHASQEHDSASRPIGGTGIYR
jgi:Phospholipase_D-nuclease N-terminal